jgi:hypothetical protein
MSGSRTTVRPSGGAVVTPATSTGSINPAKLVAAGKKSGHHGTIAVFTVTGN